MVLIASILRVVPFAGSLFKYMRTNCQLVMGWAILGVLLVVLGYTLSLWGKNKDHEIRMANMQVDLNTAHRDYEDTKFELETLKTANQDLSTALANLSNFQVATDAIVGQLVKDVLASKQNTKQMQDSIRKLEKNREDVKKYLDERVPFDLSCLRTNTCEDTATKPEKHSHQDRIREAPSTASLGSRNAVYTYYADNNQPGLSGRLDGSTGPVRRMPGILRQTAGLDDGSNRKPLTTKGRKVTVPPA